MKKNQKRIKLTRYLLPVLFLLFSFAMQVKAQDNIRRYPIKSAKLTYNIKSTEGSGIKVLFFDEYGRRESQHETLQKRGKTVKDKMIILNNKKSYTIDLLTNTGQDVSQTTGMTMKMMQLGGNDMSATGKKMLEGMGGQKVGTETFLGKNCEKWEVHTLGKTTMLLWEGIPLKTVTSVIGIKTTEEATDIKTGLSFSNSDFEPPAGVKMEQSMPEGMNIGSGMQMTDEDRQQMEKLKNMSFSDFKKEMKKGNPDLSDEEIQQAYKMIKQMGKIFK